MGRKRLTKCCTHCRKECERKQFSRSMWEKEEDVAQQPQLPGVPIVIERICRQCQFEIKKSREQETLTLAAVSVIATEEDKSSSLLMAVPSFGTRLSLGMTPSPAVMPLAVAPPSPLILESMTVGQEANEVDDDLFDGVDFEQFLGNGDENIKDKRSERAKKRRAKMNSLFSSLALDVGLPVFADRAKVLERTREVIRELRESANPAKKVKTMSGSADMLPIGGNQPVVSMLDVMNEHLGRLSNETFVSHSHCA